MATASCNDALWFSVPDDPLMETVPLAPSDEEFAETVMVCSAPGNKVNWSGDTVSCAGTPETPTLTEELNPLLAVTVTCTVPEFPGISARLAG